MIQIIEDIIVRLRRRQWLAIGVGGGLIVLGVVWWVLFPRGMSAYHSYQAWQEQQDRIQSARDWKVQLTKLEAETRRLRQQLDTLFISLPEGDRMSVVLKELQTHAEWTGIRLRSVQPRTKVSHEMYEEVPLDVAFAGSYHSIGRFIDRIERSKYLIKVEKLTLETEDLISDTIQARARFSLVTLRERTGTSRDGLEEESAVSTGRKERGSRSSS